MGHSPSPFVRALIAALPLAALSAHAQPPADAPPGAVPLQKPAQPGPQPTPHPGESDKPAREPNPGGYKLAKGPVGFSTAPTVKLKDPARNRDIEVRFRYPRTSGDGQTFPLVIISHGAGGSSDAFHDLADLIASHGYIVASPNHSDSIRLRRRQGEQIGDPVKEIEKLAEKVDPADRLADVRLILNSLDYVADFVPDMHDSKNVSKIDAAHVAVVGHSAGAYTAQLAMGVRTAQPDGTLASTGDPRITCGILISPQVTSSQSLTSDSWSQLALPTLVVVGSQESNAFTKETPEARRRPFDLAKPGDKYLLFVQGATHSSFAGKAAVKLMGDAPETDVDTIGDTLASGVIAFLDAYLKSDKPARDYLAGDGIKTVSQGKAAIERK